MKKLELIGDYDYNDQQVLKKVINHIQSQLDINPDLLQKWLNRENFDQIVLDRDRKCYRKVMDQDNPVLDKLMDVSHAESFIDESLFWEKESCGQIMDECGNGYIKYCNQHKYLHPSEHSKKSQESKIDHFFVKKNATEILEEQIFKVKFNMYLQITRNLTQAMENEFYQWINSQGYSEYFIEQKHAEEVNIWLNENSENFRSKYPIYQHDLEEIKNERIRKETRTLRSLKTLRNLKGIRGKRVKGGKETKKENSDLKNDQQSSEHLGKVYIKIYARDSFQLPECEIISRSML